MFAISVVRTGVDVPAVAVPTATIVRPTPAGSASPVRKL
jgi:hypothetical protein